VGRYASLEVARSVFLQSIRPKAKEVCRVEVRRTLYVPDCSFGDASAYVVGGRFLDGIVCG
jgi:hypothetical protein